MNRITNEQREAIVRKAVADRDALLGEPEPCGKCRKPWLCAEKGCMDKAASEPVTRQKEA